MSAPELKKHTNGTWYVHWTEGRRSKRVSTSAKEMDGKNGAKAFFGTWLLMSQQAPPEGGSAPCVRDLWTRYFDKHIKRNTTAVQTTEWSWKNLEVFFAELFVSQVTFDNVEDYIARRKAGKIGRPSVEGTIRRELSVLRACFNWCASPKQKILTKAEMPQFELPAESDPRDRWLRHEEIQKLLNAAAAMRQGDRLSRGERFLWLALETAARKTAITELTWDRVDFETGVIHYNVPGRKKTKKRRADVPISEALRPVLERAYAERLDQERTDGLVLDNATGAIWPILQRVAKRAGVADVSPHVLRHTAATHMARRGVSLWAVAGVLGNTIDMVDKVYAKHAPDGLRGAVAMISGGALEVAE
jgi:integrase